MRPRSIATTLAALTVGLTAATALHRRAGRRLAVPALDAPPAVPAVAPVTTDTTPAVALPAVALPAAGVRDGVVLPFVRPAEPAPARQQSAARERCGDNGGRTKAGAPCAARATTGGRCHHHPLAA